MGNRTYTCPISRRCGGCEWLAVPYPIQLRRKQEEMEGLFAGVCEADGCRVAPILGMGEPVAFRHKAATPFAPGPHGRYRAGFFERGSHRIVWCEQCLVEAPGARDILVDVARCAERLGIPAYDEDTGRGVLRHAVVRMGWATDEALLTLVTNGDDLPRAERLCRALTARHPELTSIVQNVNERRTNAILGFRNRTLVGPDVMHDRLLGCTFEIGPTSFYQVNPEQTQALYGAAMDAAGLEGGMRALDAYCGTGTIGICAAAEVRHLTGGTIQVTGVEQSAGAVACARRNARANGLADACQFVSGDATDFMVRVVAGRASGDDRGDGFDVVLMDPPRAGSTPEFLAAVAALAPERVVYVSCNPTTQVRDLAILRQAGYRAYSIQPVDLFPHTRHVECVVGLGR